MSTQIEYEISCKVVGDSADKNFYVILSIKDGELAGIRAINDLRTHLAVGLIFFFGSMFSLLLTQVL